MFESDGGEGLVGLVVGDAELADALAFGPVGACRLLASEGASCCELSFGICRI